MKNFGFKKVQDKITELGFSEAIKRGIIKIFNGNIYVERLLVYGNRRGYWEKRGGERYFEEQESKKDRHLRSEFIAKKIAALEVGSILEVGCGYGKQLKAIRMLDKTVELNGVDFSTAQLKKAREYLKGDNINSLFWADAADLPFEDNSFDLVFTSAVILHHPPKIAGKMRNELIRVARKYIVHNEDTNVSPTRWTYDYSTIYKDKGFVICENCCIPCTPDPKITQFVIVNIENKNA